MDALRSLSRGQPTPPSRLFFDVLTGKSSTPFNPKPPAQFRGKPVVHFSEEDIKKYSEPFLFSLIGKFSNGRPPMESLRKSFQTIGFSGSFTLGLIDYRHILIRFDRQEDYFRCWKRGVWILEGFLMRITKWHPNFTVDTESPLVPVWINFPLLPIHLFNKEALYSIAHLIGEPLKIDAATESISRPSQARVCIELDLTKDRHDEVHISLGSFSYWQKIEFEDVPFYCLSCCKIGHLKETCRRDEKRKSSSAPHPVVSKNNDLPKVIPRKEYRAIQKSVDHSPAAVAYVAAQISAVPHPAVAGLAPPFSAASNVLGRVVGDSSAVPNSVVFIPGDSTSAAPILLVEDSAASAADTANLPGPAARPVAILSSDVAGPAIPTTNLPDAVAGLSADAATQSPAIQISGVKGSSAPASAVPNSMFPDVGTVSSSAVLCTAVACPTASSPAPTTFHAPTKCPASAAALTQLDHAVPESVAPNSVAPAPANDSATAADPISVVPIPPAAGPAASPISASTPPQITADAVSASANLDSQALKKAASSPHTETNATASVQRAVSQSSSSKPYSGKSVVILPPNGTPRAVLELRFKQFMESRGRHIVNKNSHSSSDIVDLPSSNSAEHPSNVLICVPKVEDVAPLAVLAPEAEVHPTLAAVGSTSKQPLTRAELDDLLKNLNPIPIQLRPLAPVRNTVEHLSSALIPAPKIEDVAPLAALAPEATPNDNSSDFESDDQLSYDEDLEVQSSYFQPLALSRGRGKNKALTQSDRVLRPRKKH